MNNRKPTFARVGMADDPKHKSNGAPFILLLRRLLEAEEIAIFNFDPDSALIKNHKPPTQHVESILFHETSYDFLEGHK